MIKQYLDMELDQETVSRLLNILRFKQKGATISELSRKTKINRNSVAKYLQLLLISGKVEMQEIGNAKVYSFSHRLPISSLISFSSDFILLINNEGNIIQINEPYLNFFNLSESEIISKSVEEADLPLLNIPQIRSLIECGLKGEECTEDLKFDQDDKNLFFRVKSIPTVFESGQKGLTVIIENTTQQQLAEEKLKKNEEKFRNLVEFFPIPISIIDSNNACQYINKSFVDFFGYTLADIPTGKEWFNLAFPDQKLREKAIGEWLSEMENSSLVQGRPRLYTITCKDGTKKEIQFRPSKMSDGNLFVVYEDISEIREAERLHSLFSSIVSSSCEAIIGTTTEGRITIWNNGAKRLFGYLSDEITGKPFSILKPAKHKDERMAIDERIMKEGSIAYIETQLMKKDGELIDVCLTSSPIRDAEDSIIGSSIIAHDISARKRVEEALRCSEDMYRTLFEATGSGICVVEEDMTISLANSQMEKISGYNRDEIEGKRKWTDFVSEEDREKMVTYHHLRRKETKTVPEQYVFNLIKKSGEIINCLATVKLFPGTDKTLVSILDNSERKRIEDSLKNANEELEKKVLRHAHDLIVANEILSLEVTERRYAEKALREQREMTLQCLNLMGLLVVGLDKDGKILMMNKMGSEYLGNPEQVVGRSWFDYCIPKRAKEEALIVQNKILEGLLSSSISLKPIVTISGQEKEMVWYIRGLKGEQGEPSLILWLGEDPPGEKIISLSRVI
jgi:PAS domain S-box-containing protein